MLIGCAVKENEDALALVQEELGTSNVHSLYKVPEYFIVCHKQADKVSSPAPSSCCRLLLRPLHAIAGGCRESGARRLPLPLARGPLNAVRQRAQRWGEGSGGVDERGGQGQTASSYFIDSLSLVQETLAGLLKQPQA